MRKGILLLVALLVFPAVVASIDFDPLPIGPFTLNQSETFTYDFNATNLTSGLPVPEDGSLISYVVAAAESNIDSSSNWSLSNVTGLFLYTPSNSDSFKQFNLIFQIIDPGEEVIYRSRFVNFTILNVNDPPEVVSYQPLTTFMNASENEATQYNVTFTDPDFLHGIDNISVEWIVNGTLNTLVENQSSASAPYHLAYTLNYLITYCDAGDLNITARATDIEGLFAQQEWMLNVTNVNRPITFNGTIPDQEWNESEILEDPFNLYDYFEDLDFLECTGDNQDEIVFTVNGTEEINVTIDALTGNITFEAPQYWRGIEYITITGSDNESNATSNLITLLVLSDGYAPIIYPIPPVNTSVGAANEIFVRVQDVDLPFGDNITYLHNSSIASFTIDWYNQSGNESYGRIAFLPDAFDIGNHSINITVNDTYGYENSTIFFLQIFDNEVPILDPIGNLDSTQDIPLSVEITASDADDEPLIFLTNFSFFGLYEFNDSYNAYIIPSLNDTAATLAITPTNADVGNWSVTIRACDPQNACDQETILFQVINVNDPPSLDFIPTLYAKVGEEFVSEITGTDPDLPWGDILTYADNSTLFSITKLTEELAEIRFTPILGVDEGNYSIRVNVTDAAGLYAERVFLLVIQENLPPVLDPVGDINATENMPFELIISAYDPNFEPLIFTFNDTIWSDHATQINDTAIRIEATYNKSQVGNYSILVNVTDGDGEYDNEIVLFQILEIDNPPVIISNFTIYMNESRENIVILEVLDLEGDEWNITSNSSFLLNVSANTSNYSQAIINATPPISLIGNWSVNFTVTQISNASLNTTSTFDVIVQLTPEIPSISNTTPESPVSTAEGASILFSADIDDPDFPAGDVVTVNWYYNDVLVMSESSNETFTTQANITFGYCDAGAGTILLEAIDQFDARSEYTWILDIENTNRPPVFGERLFTTSTLNGTLENITWNGSAYVLEPGEEMGTLISTVYNYGHDSAQFIEYLSSIIQGTIPAGSQVFISLRSGFNPNPASASSTAPGWTDWSPIVDIGEPFPAMSSRQYVQIRLTYYTTTLDTPSVENLTLTYRFADHNVSVGLSLGIYDLNVFFYDPDNECLVGDEQNATVGILANSIVTIDQETLRIDLEPLSPGTETVQFTYTDGEYDVTSNAYLLTTNPSSIIIPIPVPSGGGGSSSTQTITIPRDSPVPEPFPLDLILPEEVFVNRTGTITVNITLANTFNGTLENISLEAYSEIENLTFSYDPERFEEIESESNVTTTLTISTTDFYGSYFVTLAANVSEPPFNATNRLLISALEIGREGDEEFNTRLTFVRDLVESRPECLELNEQIDRARTLSEQGEGVQARIILDAVLENCRYLIQLDGSPPALESPTSLIMQIRSAASSEVILYTGIIVAILVILSIMLFAFSYRH